ncbi:Tetraspanin-9, partial [Sarcoptes scabiei]
HINNYGNWLYVCVKISVFFQSDCLAGSCILGVGLWLFISYNTYARILPSYQLLSADNLAIFIGSITFLIAFCGCCGSWFQNKTLLMLYLISIILVMVVEIITGVVCFVYQTKISQTLQNELLNGIQHRFSLNDTNGVHSTWDQIQSRFECCGVYNYTDWYNIDAWPNENRVPTSCCRSSLNETVEHSLENCGFEADKHTMNYWKHGCYQKIHYYLLSNIHGVGIVSILFAFIQFTALVSAFLIVFTMNYKKEKRKQKQKRSQKNRSAYNRIRTF